LNWVMVHSVDHLRERALLRFAYRSMRVGEFDYVLYYLPLLLLVILLSHWERSDFRGSNQGATDQDHRVVGALLVIVLVLAHPSSAGSTHGKLRIDFLMSSGRFSIGYFPDNTTLLIDAGGRPVPS